MQFYGHASQVADQILSQFQNGSLPQSLAPVFLHRQDDAPCRKWSWNNQLLVAIAGYSEARSLKQWNAVNRRVRKGEKAFHILAPCFVRPEPKPDEQSIPAPVIVGFKSLPVFGYEQTEGTPLPGREAAARFLETLPLREVAEAWGLSIGTYAGQNRSAAGMYSPTRGAILLGVENLSTWCHELVHAADDRLGNLKERGQHWASETVAELGAATLLCAMGHDADADLGGAWEYVSRYTRGANMDPLKACFSVLTRVCSAVDLILTTADTLRNAQQVQAA